MLEQAEVVHYLLDRRLLTAAAVVDGNVVVRDASSRNRNYRVESTAGPSYLLKQGVDVEGAATVAHEASVYQSLYRSGSDLAEGLVAFHGYDAHAHVLVLELASRCTDLRTRHARDGHCRPELAARLGTALGALHRTTAGWRGSASAHQLPWALVVHRPDHNVFRDASSATLDVIRVVQQTAGFPDRLDALRTDWRAEALIHNDVKWENVLVSSDDAEVDELKLIDWEAGMIGDPCWDAGSVLGSFLSWWLFSIPVTGALPPRRFPELAQRPLDGMKPAMRAFWLAYREASMLEASEHDERLERVVRFAAARLLQTALEACQMMTELTGNVVLHLQLSANILERPSAAAIRLLGLPMGRRTP